MRVLIVDDDDGDVLIMTNCLHDNDNKVEVLRAYDGGDALAILGADNDAPDLVLLDNSVSSI